MDNAIKCHNLFLIGLMGAGKSTVGRRLARALGWEFLDCDREIQARTGVEIPLIFEIEGEAGFRDREARMLEQLTARRSVVLATGGGAVLRPDNRTCLTGRGVVVYLRAPVELLYARTRRNRHRPLLHTADPRARLAALLEEREPLYLQCADLIVDTAGRTVPQLVDQIRCERDRLCAP